MHQRGSRAKGKSTQRSKVGLRQKHQMLRQERTMNHQSGIAFDITGIIQIIVYAVTIEGQRGIAKQKRRRKRHIVPVRFIARGHRRYRSRGIGRWIFPIDQIMPFAQAQLPVLMNIMAQGNKGQRPGAAVFACGAFQHTGFHRINARKQRCVKFKPPARPHPARQAHIRDQPAHFRVPVTPQLIGRLRRPEIQLVKKRRQGTALTDRRRLPQRNFKRRRPCRIQNIGLTVFALCRIIIHTAQDMALTGQGQLPMTPHITAIDHLVLTVADIPRTIRFYRDVLGAQPKEFPVADGSTRWALDIGAQKINLHLHGNEFEPKSAHPTPGSADLCFLSDAPADLWCAHLAALDVPIEDGPVKRTGATGPILSIYLRDPDQNLIEIGTPPGT